MGMGVRLAPCFGKRLNVRENPTSFCLRREKEEVREQRLWEPQFRCPFAPSRFPNSFLPLCLYDDAQELGPGMQAFLSLVLIGHNEPILFLPYVIESTISTFVGPLFL